MKKFLAMLLIMFLATACTKEETNNSSSVPFPQLVYTPSVYNDAYIQGELVLENDCLRVKDTVNEKSFLLIWRPDFSTRVEGSTLQVIDLTGQVVASVGDYVQVNGGGDNNPTWYGLKEPLPENCPGPYFLVGGSMQKMDKP